MASNCSSVALKGIPRDCASSLGGVTKIALINYSDLTGTPTVTASADGAGEITAIPTGSTGKIAYYYPRKGACSLTETFNVDNATGLSMWTSEVVITFSRMEASKRAEIQAMSLNEMAVLVLDSNGITHYLGFSEPVVASAGTGQTGQAKTDANSYSITLQDDSAVIPYTVAKELADSIWSADTGK